MIEVNYFIFNILICIKPYVLAKGGDVILILYNHGKVVSYLWVHNGGGDIRTMMCLMLSIFFVLVLWFKRMCLVNAFFV